MTEASAATTKKKKEELKIINKIKDSKAFKKRKRNAADSDDDDDIARAIFEENHAPLPGQMENCEICQKRFTVTPYSVAGPDGGLLCAPCGKKVASEREKDQPKKKKPAPKKVQAGGIGSRRHKQSRMMDGDIGAPSLVKLCVQKLAKNVELAESLGDLPENMIDRIARIISKQRLLNSMTLPLFVQPTTERLHIYDGGNLADQDLISVFQTAPKLRRFKARCVVQFKDEVMDYVLSRDIKLESFYLHGANLLSEEKWHEFLQAKGKDLKELQVYHTDCHFGDDTLSVIAEHCPSLNRLKIEGNQKITDEGLKAIGRMKTLDYLGLRMLNPSQPTSSTLSTVITQIGRNLRTFSLRMVHHIDDTVLDAVHDSCRSVTKFRITENEVMTDAGFARLFTDWNNPPLEVVDLQACRYVSASAPRVNEHNVGLCGEGFKALMEHSRPAIRDLNVHACRFISGEAFEYAFRKGTCYPELVHLEISFCEEVSDYILGRIFRACPKIQKVNVFGCFKVKDVRVPRGVILIGVPTAQGMITEGQD